MGGACTSKRARGQALIARFSKSALCGRRAHRLGVAGFASSLEAKLALRFRANLA
jgi:hypothetical protein